MGIQSSSDLEVCHPAHTDVLEDQISHVFAWLTPPTDVCAPSIGANVLPPLSILYCLFADIATIGASAHVGHVNQPVLVAVLEGLLPLVPVLCTVSGGGCFIHLLIAELTHVSVTSQAHPIGMFTTCTFFTSCLAIVAIHTALPIIMSHHIVHAADAHISMKQVTPILM